MDQARAIFTPQHVDLGFPCGRGRSIVPKFGSHYRSLSDAALCGKARLAGLGGQEAGDRRSAESVVAGKRRAGCAADPALRCQAFRRRATMTTPRPRASNTSAAAVSPITLAPVYDRKLLGLLDGGVEGGALDGGVVAVVVTGVVDVGAGVEVAAVRTPLLVARSPGP